MSDCGLVRSLLLSWVIAMTMTPLNCISLLRPPKDEDPGADPYAGGFFRFYRRALEGAIRWRVFTLAGVTAMLVVAVVGNVPQEFFPASTRTQFMIDYWAPEGTPIQTVSTDLKGIEAKLKGDARVKNVTAFIGAD